MITRRTFGLLATGTALTATSIVHAQQVLKVGLIPSEDSRAMLAQSKDILDAVEKNSGMKVQGFVATDYNGVIEALRAKHLDIAYLGPFSYVLATTVTPVEAFAIAETAKAGRTYYHSKIIALKSSGTTPMRWPSPTARSMPPPSPTAFSMPPSPRATSRPIRSRSSGSRRRFLSRPWCGARISRPR
jgi:phosphonate transport system substrate-binding protein